MMKRSELVRRLSTLGGFDAPSARTEQVTSPPEAAAELLGAADARSDLVGRTVLDLGCGPGILGIGAALLGAARVQAVDSDPNAIATAQANAAALGVVVEFSVGPVEGWSEPADTIVMNPPFGAQQRHADRPFWERAGALAGRGIYAFSLADSRSFIQRWAVAHAVSIDLTQPVRWDLPSTFPHHRKSRVALPVDLWVLRRERAP